LDSEINRVLKAAARKLSTHARGGDVRHRLVRIVESFDSVEDLPLGVAPPKVFFNRLNKRFTDVYSFGIQILLGLTSEPCIGPDPGYAMVFSMHDLFEQFVATFMVRNAQALGLDRRTIHPQAKGRRRFLLESTQTFAKAFPLMPDIYIDVLANNGNALIDTKWKLLSADDIDPINGISRADAYQMMVYAFRYRCQNIILLYPAMASVRRGRFRVPDSDVILRVETLSMDYPLRKNKTRLLADITRILWGDSAT
jgi:5-methylcytosine-specific restriction enzyme subunit McrC